MKKLLLLALVTIFTFSLASAQGLNKVVFGPLVGDDAGVITVTNGQPNVEVQVWVRTDPANPDSFYAVAHVLMSEDAIILNRNGHTWDPYYDVPAWGQVNITTYLPDPTDLHPIPPGHIVEATMALFDFPQGTGYALDTGGEWDYYGSFWMDMNTGIPEEQMYSPLSAGWLPHSGQESDWAYPIPPGGSVSPAQSFAEFFVTANTDPEFTVCPEAPCADVGVEICLAIEGSDADVLDSLVISQTGGPGVYTPDVEGPGGTASGTWCWDEPTVGMHTVTLVLNDFSGGTATCEFTIEVTQIGLTMACPVPGVPGANAVVPVRLTTCVFETGAMTLLFGWDPTVLTLLSIDPTSRIDFGNEYWYVNVGDDGSTARVTWISDINNGVPHPPAWPGNDPIMNLRFHIASGLPWGMEIPVTFMIPHYSDNTITDASGYIWFRPALTDGCVVTEDMEAWLGDPNMDGSPYTVGDAFLVARRLIHCSSGIGCFVWEENGPDDDLIQEAASDLNGNGFADVSDLIWFIRIINHEDDPPSKVEPSSAMAELSMPEVIGDNMEVSINAGIDVGGVLVSIDHSGVELGAPVADNGMELLYHDADGVMNVVVFSMQANVLPAGSSTLFTIPVLSNEGGSMSFAEVSSADFYGRLMETVASLEAPLPTTFAVEQNYPNPFNARTQIGLALPEASDVTVDIYSVTGQLVESISGHFEAGNHSITWDASDVSSGVYFYKVTAGDFSQTMKMTLLK